MCAAVHCPRIGPFFGLRIGREIFEPQRDGWWVVETGGEHFFVSKSQLQNIILLLLGSTSATELVVQRGPHCVFERHAQIPTPPGWEIIASEAKRLAWRVPQSKVDAIGGFFKEWARHEEWIICFDPRAEEAMVRLAGGFAEAAATSGLTDLGQAVVCIDSDWGLVFVFVHEDCLDAKGAQQIAGILGSQDGTQD
jgi:hypothetical protein